MQLVVTSIKDFLKKLKGAETASVIYPPAESNAPRQIPEPSTVGGGSQRRHSGREYAPSHSVRGSDLPNPNQAYRVLQEWMPEIPRSGLEYSSDEEQRGQ